MKIMLRHKLGILAVIAVAGIFGFCLYFYFTIPDVSWLKNQNPTTTAMMQYKGDQHFSSSSLQLERSWIPLRNISPNLIKAVINAEDIKFFQHHGFDFHSLYIAIKLNFESGRIVKGGSTITQQLAKNLYLKPSRTVVRKIREALITIHLEKKLKKERILEIYLNIIEWGPEIYGAESAARYYFNKSATELSLSESLRLASVISNPIANNPLDDENSFLKLSQYRKFYRMFERHWIDLRTFVQILGELNTPIPSEYATTLCRTLCFQQMVFLI